MPRLHNTRDNYELGARLKSIRVRQKITQEELADAVGFSYQQLHKYERGKNAITVATLKRLAAALGVHPCELCGCCANEAVQAANAEIVRQMKAQHERGGKVYE